MSIKKALIIGLGILIAVRTTGGILRLISAGQEVEMAEKELALAQEENTKLNERLTEVNSPEFVLKEAKEKLGLGIPGDEIVISPEVVSEQLSVDSTEPEANWRKWWKLYIGI